MFDFVFFSGRIHTKSGVSVATASLPIGLNVFGMGKKKEEG